MAAQHVDRDDRDEDAGGSSTRQTYEPVRETDDQSRARIRSWITKAARGWGWDTTPPRYFRLVSQHVTEEANQ